MLRFRREFNGLFELWKTVFLWSLLSTVLGTATGADVPIRPPSRLIPARGLTLYFEYDGLDAHSGAWKATAASQILNGTPAGAMMTDVALQTLGGLLKVVPGNTFTGADLIAFQDHVIHRGMTFASYEKGGNTSTVFLFNDFGRKEIRARFNRLLQFLLKPGEGQALPNPTQVRGRDVSVFRQAENADAFPGLTFPQAGPTWWLEGDTLIVVRGPVGDLGEAMMKPDETRKALTAAHLGRVNAVLDAIEGKVANASAHPGVVAARAEGRDLTGFESNGLFLVETVKGGSLLRELRERYDMPGSAGIGTANELDVLEILGMGQARRVIGRWGFREKALLTDVRFEGQSPWKGMVGMLDPAGFGKDRLPPIPRRSGAFLVGSLRRGMDPQSWAILRGIVSPKYRPSLEATERILADTTNRRVIEEVIRRVGPTWSVYAAPGGGNDKEGVPTFLIGVEDVDALDKTLETTASRLNTYFREEEFGAGAGQKPDDRRPTLALKRLPAPERGYRVISPTDRIPWLTDNLQPTILLGKSFAVVAANPSLARAAVEAESRVEGRWERSGDCAKLFACLPARLSMLIVGNPRDSSWPDAIVELPQTASAFLGKFVGVDVGKTPTETQPSGLLSLLGARTPAPNGPGQALNSDDLRSRIFPSLLAATVDERGVRILSLEALPLGCIGFRSKYEGDKHPKSFTLELKIGEER